MTWRQLLGRLFLAYYVLVVLWFFIALRTFLGARRRFKYQLKDAQRELYRANSRLDFDLGTKDFLWLCFGGVAMVSPSRIYYSSVRIKLTVSGSLTTELFAYKCTLDLTLHDFDDVNGGEVAKHLAPRARKDQARQQWFLKTLRYLVTLHCAIEMWLLGVWTVREWKVLNCDFDFAAEDSEKKIVLEPLSDENRVNQYSIRSYVSNHISIVDTLFFIVKIYPSFLAKSQVFHHPLVGPPARALNCVFLNRKSAVDRERTIKVIGARQNEIWKLSVKRYLSGKETVRVSPELRKFIEYEERLSGKTPFESGELFSPSSTPPLLVFPEGTTSSGRQIIPLKRGAFIGLKPVTPAVLVYRCPQFNLSYDIMPAFWTLPLMLSNLRPTTLDVYWLREVSPESPIRGGDQTLSTRIDAFGKEVRKRMSRVLVAAAHWHIQRDEPIPDAWTGSMQTKMECMNLLFDRRE